MREPQPPAREPHPQAGQGSRVDGQAPASDQPADAQAPAAQQQPMPPGQRLRVLDAPEARAVAAAAGAAPTDAAVRTQAMPLRVQGTAGMRDMPQPSGGPPIVPSEDGDFWYATVSSLVAKELIGALARELALQSQLVARDDDQWLLRIERESLGQAGSRDKLQGALAAIGHSVKISIEIGAVSDSPARRNKQAAEARQREAEEAIHNDPLVQAMMRDFDARIVPGSLRPA